MHAMVLGCQLRGFFGGIILRHEEQLTDCAARLSLLQSDEPIEKESPDETLLGLAFGPSLPLNGRHLHAMILWMEHTFTEFAFDLIAMLHGTYRPGRVSSWHGVGIALPPAARPDSTDSE